MRIIVTGACGFVGSELLSRLNALIPTELAHRSPVIIGVDRHIPEDWRLQSPFIRCIAGDIASDAFLDALLSEECAIFFHLASVPGGAAEKNYETGWATNVEASIRIFQRLARQARPPRIVFASSIAVFGVPLPSNQIDDDTLPMPSMSYGAQKLIVETLLADLSRRGLIDGIGLRLPGIVARPYQSGGHLSAYLSNVFHCLATGNRFICPVSPDSTSWLMSRQQCIDNLVHAAFLPETKLRSARRNFNLPALSISMVEVVNALADRFGADRLGMVSYEPNAAIQAQFGSYPPLKTELAEQLGFSSDGAVDALVQKALELQMCSGGQ